MYAIGHIVLYSAFLIGSPHLNNAFLIDPNRAPKSVLKEDALIREPSEPVKIPETLLMKLDSVQSVPEFLRKFVESKESVFQYWLVPQVKVEKTNGTAVNSSRKSSPRARKLNPNDISVPYGKPAKCQPELQVVSLQKPAGNVIHWPSCVRVKRCGGCCGGTLKACTPLQASLYNMTVIEASYDPRNPDYFHNPKEVVISVEQHTKCACTCRHQANKCGRMQRFDEDNCHCVCLNRNAQCPPHMVWDDYHCECKCREKLECSTGRYFNVQECKCEEFSSIECFFVNETSAEARWEMRRVPPINKDEDISSHQAI